MKDTYRIVEYPKGHYGYKFWCELQVYNCVYDKFYSIKDALDIQFIKDYCLLHQINYESIPHEVIS